MIVGDRYTELDPTFGIHFIGFPLLPKPWPLHAHVELRMPQFKDRFLTDQLSLEYLDFSQLSSFTFGDILDNKLLSLMYFLMHKGRSEDTHMAEIEKKYPELNEINTRFKKALHDDSVWIEAERREKFARDQIAIRQYAEEEGIEKGKDLGRTEVLSQMVTNMRSQGFSWEQISAISGRSIKELTQLPGTSKDLDS